MDDDRREMNRHHIDAQDNMAKQLHNLDKEVGVLDYALHTHIDSVKARDEKVDGRFDELFTRLDKLTVTYWKGMAIGVALILFGPEIFPYLKLLF